MRRLLVIALVCAVAGCGTERSVLPDASPDPGAQKRRLSFPHVGMAVSVPKRLLGTPRQQPSVFRGSLGNWSVGGFAYRRREQLPRDRTELEAARRRLVRQARGRGRRWRLIRSRVTRVARTPAVELVGNQTISRARLRTRSLHLYKGSAEYVIELLAPPREFRRADRVLFGPLLRSLKVTGKIKPPPRKRRKSR